MLDTDDVIRVRVAAKCRNDGRRYGKMGKIFFQLLHSDPFMKHWYYDAEGYKLCTLKYPIMESFRRMGLQEAEVFIPPPDLFINENEDMSRSAEGRISDLFINQRYAECHGIDMMSNGSMSPDVGDMWHRGYPVSQQWEGELELDSASDCDNAYGAMVKGMKDYISVIRECSLWILIRDSLCPPDILSLRTAGRKRNKAKIYGEFAALGFFLMTNKEDTSATPLPEWPSLCFDYRQNFGFVPSATELGEWPDMVAFGCAGERT